MAIPRAYTRRLCRDRPWQLWSQEWEALEDGTGMDGGDAKVYLQFMPTLGLPTGQSVERESWGSESPATVIWSL